MQGFNMGRYVPPEYEGTTSGNALAGKHALGNRARKISQGILTVRFEMPFAIWCTSCPKPTIIAQGVRFNAEKKKVGNYYSTSIYSFRMKHTPCGGWIEIRTDPKNTQYVVTSGATKRDTGQDKVLEGEIKILTGEEREKEREDAFKVLEARVSDKKQAQTHKTRIEELEKLSDRQWDDPYEVNKRLRRTFRAGRKARQHDEKVAEDLKDKMSLNIDLLAEDEEDSRRAALVDFGELDPESAIRRTETRPLFGKEIGWNQEQKSRDSNSIGGAGGVGRVNGHKAKNKQTHTTEEVEKERRRRRMTAEFSNNTRAAMDPFLVTTRRSKSREPISLGIKRKRSQSRESSSELLKEGMKDESLLEDEMGEEKQKQQEGRPALSLVDYDSE